MWQTQTSDLDQVSTLIKVLEFNAHHEAKCDELLVGGTHLK